MTLTFIDTPSHGYLRVPKHIFKQSGMNSTDISRYSGMDSTNLYLEEDCDASAFLNYLETEGIEFDIISIHRDRSSVPSHNYNSNF